ncbi:glycine betaine ABC transporter substrate-binding protein [Microbacterium protaetiae]|uniref:Glycine betaine ABC transporter substrate-binding protein n=1 Tax=Microbacterium protaetiae TaxID=2509458 RepID=A0A4P6ECJ0_9MICO|nr:glycine betaine ABC transporter substrate-binding protein [Microbacterium protaetiae]QAY59774.1 glycine betaine ABC transporter substrate-binding protein [Microbacterium protaetiae]
MKKRTLLGALAMGVAASVALVGCASGTGGDAGDAGGDTQSKDITVGVFNGWPEGEAASYLWQQVLQKQGYNVDLEYADAGPVFAGLAKGDYDVAFDGWLPTTHASYFDKYGDDLVDLGSWNDDAKLTLAVNADAPIDSIEDLAAHADEFDNRIVGIEPGAGLTEAVEKKTIPQYGLDDMDFITSSTPAMLAELKKALDADENIVVTLWRPHWAYDAFDIKDLKDPKGTLGDAESIHTITRTGFSDDFSEVNTWFKAFRMDSDLLFSLENAMFREEHKQSEYEGIVAQWMADNQDYVDSLTS